MEVGKIELLEEMVDVNEVLGVVLDMMRRPANEKNLNLVLQIPENIPGLYADKRSLKQMALNLMSNAVKFTPDGGKVSLTAYVGSENQFRISVRDNGIGIAPQDFKKVMSPFGQVNNSLSKKTEGTGLGLPLVKSMMELHGGQLILQSAAGEGTKTTLCFPASRSIKRSTAA